MLIRTVPPRSPRVTARVAPGRIRSTRAPSRVPGSMSSLLTPTRSAAASSGSCLGGRRSTSAPGTRRRRRPCQPRAMNGAETDAHAGPSSPATEPRKTASFARHSAGNASVSIGSAAERQRWRRPPGPSTFSNTGPFASPVIATATPAARNPSSSLATAASASAPTSARTRSPSRASVSEPYVTAPPRRQPLGSPGVTSRAAAPTTSTVGRDAPATAGSITIGPNGARVYPAGPFPKHPEPFLVFLRAARRRR